MDVFKNQAVGDDNRKVISEKRFNTFKKKYDPYKSIYEMNKRHIKYANWFFEEKLLGYSYSHTVREVFQCEDDFNCAHDIKNAEERSKIRFVGIVTDIIKRISRNGNKYGKITNSR